MQNKRPEFCQNLPYLATAVLPFCLADSSQNNSAPHPTRMVVGGGRARWRRGGPALGGPTSLPTSTEQELGSRRARRRKDVGEHYTSICILRRALRRQERIVTFVYLTNRLID